jgi:hypothetical protein
VRCVVYSASELYVCALHVPRRLLTSCVCLLLALINREAFGEDMVMDVRGERADIVREW